MGSGKDVVLSPITEARVMTFRLGNSHYTGLGALVVSGLLLVFASGCGPKVEDLRTEGIEQYRNRQYVESMATMRHVLDLEPSDAEANYYMGLNYRMMAARRFREGDVVGARRRIDRALLYFTQAVKSWPNYMAAVAAKNEALEARGKYDEALAVAKHVAHNNRGDAEHYVFLAHEYRDRGDYDSALRNYKTALASNPNSAEAYAGMGRLYELVGDRALAMDAYRRAHELNPRNSEVADRLDSLHAAPEVHTATHDYEP